MSFFSAIAAAEHSFASWAEKELHAIEGKLPQVEKVVDAIFKYVGPALQIIVNAEAGNAAGAIVGKVVSEAQTSLTAASALVYDFGSNPSATSIVSSVQANLSGLLSASHITNATSVANTTKVVNELGLLVTALSTPKS